MSKGDPHVRMRAACDADPKTGLLTVVVVASRGARVVTLDHALTSDKTPEMMMHVVAGITAELCQRAYKELHDMTFRDSMKRRKQGT